MTVFVNANKVLLYQLAAGNCTCFEGILNGRELAVRRHGKEVTVLNSLVLKMKELETNKNRQLSHSGLE